jgi:hypothetical protein
LPVGAGDRLGTDALDNIQRRQDDVSVPQVVENTVGQHDALVGLQGQLGRGMDSLPIVRQAERLHAQICTQLKQMLAPGFFLSAYCGQHDGSMRSCRPIHCSRGIGTAASGSRP